MLILFVMFVPAKAHADVTDFVITNFEADYYLNRNSSHGSLDVTEKIDVEFHDYNHGILRAIPKSYKHHPLKLKVKGVSSPSGAPAQYTTYKSNGNTVLRIGDPSRTVTGVQSYEIKYSVQNVVSFFADHDELFWDINGDQWDQPFQLVTARFHVPTDLSDKLQDRQACYSGTFGSLVSNCQITRADESSGKLVTVTAPSLGPRETLSVVLGFNSGTFAPYTWRDGLSDHQKDIVIGLVSLMALVVSFRHWWLKGRDPKGAGVIVPQYGPPKNISVLDAGILQDYHLDNKDITAVLIDLAVRGYVTIVEEDKKVLGIKTGTKNNLILNNPDTSKLTDYETTLLTTVFDAPLKAGSTKSLGKYISGMQRAIEGIGSTALERLTKAGLFDTNPQRPGYGRLVLLLILAGLMAFIGFKTEAYFGASFSLGVILIIVLLILHMPRRSRMGALYNDDLKGLKMYMSLAEADRIKMLQSPGARYAENAHEPKRTVKLFEKLLPFAIIFGVEKQWAKQFEGIYTTPPNWYHGNWATFNAIALTNHISSGTYSAMNASFSPPSSSSGSGFSGGGSGGGGGGGGGGGW